MILIRHPTEVGFLHKVKIVHRDIKPFSQSVMIPFASPATLLQVKKKYDSRSIQIRVLKCFFT